jgi:hypothetical protein
MKVLNARCSSSLLMGLGSLALTVGLLACGGDSGSDAGDASSSSAGSSSSAYVPPETDADAPVIIENFSAEVTSTKVKLLGSVVIDQDKSDTVKQIDSLVFGVLPSGPEVTINSLDAGEYDFTLTEKNAYISLDFEGCGTYTVYMSAYAEGKPVTVETKFTKDASLCVEVSSSSSSAVVGKTFESTVVTMAAQKKGNGIHAIDLDAMKTYTDISAMAADAKLLDIIFGVDENGEAYVYNASSVGHAAYGVPDYASVSGTYAGSFYDTEVPNMTTSVTTDQIVLKDGEKASYLALDGGNYYVVATDKYNAATQEGLFIFKFATILMDDNAQQSAVEIWSVVE